MGCGNNDGGGATAENSATYRVKIQQVSFPTKQQLAKRTMFKLTASNPTSQPLPNVAVTVDSFAKQLGDPNLSDSAKPIWIVDAGPAGGDTAYTNTWALGRVAPGRSKTFTWQVTPLEPGIHTVKYKVSATTAAGSRTLLEDGSAPEGSFTVNVSRKAAKARVGENGEVVRER